MVFRRTILAAALAVTSGGGISAFAEEPVQFTPSGPWTADFADNSCSLRRYFEHGETKVFLQLRKYAPGAQMEVSIGSDPLAVRPKKVPETRFLPDTEVEQQNFHLMIDGDKGWKAEQFWDSLALNEVERSYRSSDEPWLESPAERKAAISAYEVKNAFERDIELLTGSMDKPDAVMAQCMDSLVSSWGIDASVQKTLTRPIDGSNNRELMQRLGAVQSNLLRSKGVGQIHLRAVVDEQGAATDCVVAEFSAPGDKGGTELCEALDHVKFEPALDANSHPVKSYVQLSLTAIRRYSQN